MCIYFWEMKNPFPSKILRLLKYQCDEKLSNTISSNERPITLRLEGLPIIVILLKVNEDGHKSSNMTMNMKEIKFSWKLDLSTDRIFKEKAWIFKIQLK